MAEVQSHADKLRLEGNEHYEHDNFDEAIVKYKIAAQKYHEAGQTSWEVKTLCNIALAYLKQKEPEMALTYADKSVELDSKNSKAYYRRAQALEVLDRKQECVEDFTTSFTLNQVWNTFITAVKIAVEHGCKIRGISLTCKHQNFLENTSHMSADTNKADRVWIYQHAIKERFFGIIPLLKFVLNAEVNYHDIVKEITWPECKDEVEEMVTCITSHAKYLQEDSGVAKIMGTELIKEAITQDNLGVAEVFVNELEVEDSVINVSKLLKGTDLRYEPKLLQKLLRKNVNLVKCEPNPIKIVLEAHYECKSKKLDMIRILVEEDANVNFELPGTTIIHEVVNSILECPGPVADCNILNLVCERFNFEHVLVNDKSGKTPWHLALRKKKCDKRLSVAICEVLSCFPINPSQKDNEGKRADSTLKDEDPRVVILRKKEGIIKTDHVTDATKQSNGQHKKKKKKVKNSIQKDTQQREVIVTGVNQDTQKRPEMVKKLPRVEKTDSKSGEKNMESQVRSEVVGTLSDTVKPGSDSGTQHIPESDDMIQLASDTRQELNSIAKQMLKSEEKKQMSYVEREIDMERAGSDSCANTKNEEQRAEILPETEKTNETALHRSEVVEAQLEIKVDGGAQNISEIHDPQLKLNMSETEKTKSDSVEENEASLYRSEVVAAQLKTVIDKTKIQDTEWKLTVSATKKTESEDTVGKNVSHNEAEHEESQIFEILPETEKTQLVNGTKKIPENEGTEISFTVTDEYTTLEEMRQSIKNYLERLHTEKDEYFQNIHERNCDQPTLPTSITHTALNQVQLTTVKRDEVKNEQNTVERCQSEDLTLYFESPDQVWNVELTEEVKKTLTGKKHRNVTHCFLEKMKILTQGEFMNNEKHCKSVSKIKGLELYETRLNEKIRILWQIAIGFLDKPDNEKHIFTEFIRVLDVVFDHDNIHHSVKKIEKNVHMRGCQVSKIRLKCLEQLPSVESNKRYPRMFVEDDKKDSKVKEVTKFTLPIHSDENIHTFTPLYSLSTCMVKHMLEDVAVEKAFPYKTWPAEHDIINMSRKEAILLLGRSGTGKTTCCLYHMWNQFKAYWSRCPDVEFNSIPKRQLSQCTGTESEEESCQSDDSVLCGSVKDNNIYDHLHQVFITKNYVLCSRLRKHFYKLAATDECAKHQLQLKGQELPCKLENIDDLFYPLFLTARQFYILLDYSMDDNNYFFQRDKEGKMTERIISDDYDHENPDSLYDFEESDDEGDTFYDLYPTNLGQQRTARREVTASYFEDKIWPKDPNETGGMSSLMVWMEIKSFIKGSREAIESECGYLTEEEYNRIGKKTAPNFAGNRKVVYKLFQHYKQFMQNERYGKVFDECDLIHNIFQRLKKQRKELGWALHHIYIDEVQDFTQGELWLMLHNCTDPNGFFLTGDTAQSIMSGVAFRFEDVRTLFHDLKRQNSKNSVKIIIPRVHHLTINLRSHSGILSLAASVTDVLREFFPNSFDHKNLPREGEAELNGPKPIFFNACSASDLAIVLAGNKRECSSIDFGAHQAILVRNQEAKEKLPKDLSSAIVLTIFESKGLEFDDVLLYNFFTDSKLSDEWRTLVYYCEQKGILSLVQRPHPLEFKEEKHKQLNSELKHLYTAITRTKTKLWIFESDSKHDPALYYWQVCGSLVELQEFSEKSDEIFASTSTCEDWKARGDEFFHNKLWEVAIKCYKKANCVYKVQECEAFVCFKNAQKIPSATEKQRAYLTAAISFLKCDAIQNTPRVLAHAAKCLHNGKMHDMAARLYFRLKKFDDALKGYAKLKKFDQCVEVLEAQHMYCKAVTFLFRSGRYRDAAQLASKYVRESHMKLSDVEHDIISYGKKLIQEFSESKSGDKKKLLTVIDCIPPKMQVEYLKKVEDYERATAILISLEKYDDAYALMLTQAMFGQAFDLAKKCGDNSKIHETVLQATKSMLVSERYHSEVPELLAELTQMCRSDNVKSSIKAHGYLLLSVWCKEEFPCHEALRLFHSQQNVLGECEAFVVLVGLPDVKRDLKCVERMVKVCFETNKICTLLMDSVPSKHTANFKNIMQQVEDFYGFTKHNKEYLFPLHQDIWKLHSEVGSSPMQSLIQLKLATVCKMVCQHLESNVVKLLDNVENQKTIQNSLERCKLYQKVIERPSNYNDSTLCDYLKAYSLALERKLHLPPSKCTDLEMWKSGFLDLFKIKGLLFLKLNSKHLNIIRNFPGAIQILQKKIDSALNTPTHHCKDDWIDVCLLSSVLQRDECELNRKVRQDSKINLSKREMHYFINVKGQYIPHFGEWISFCRLVRGGTHALVAIKILTRYIEKIARRRSIQSQISIDNTVFMMGVGTVVLYCFLKLILPQGTIIVIPQVVLEMMECFDRVNCQQNGDKRVFESCFITSKLINVQKQSLTIIESIKHIFCVLTGAFRENFTVLHAVASGRQDNSAVTCIALGLTLLGNMSLLNFYEPFDLLDYQTRIWHALQLVVKPSKLKAICDKFPYCTSSRVLFALVQELNQIHYDVYSGSTSDLFLLQVTGRGFQLKPTQPQRLPENFILPLQIEKPSSAETFPTEDNEPSTSFADDGHVDEQLLHHEDITNSPQLEHNEAKYDSQQLEHTKDKTDSPQLEDNEDKTDSPQLEHSEDKTDSPQLEHNEDKTDSPQLEHSDDLDLERLDSHSSNEDDFDEEIKKVLGLEEDESVPDTPERQISLDETITDRDSCYPCGITFQGDGSNDASFKEHIGTESHRRREEEYRNFEITVKVTVEQECEWIAEIEGWKKSSELDSLIFDIKEKIKRIEDIKNSTQKNREWKEGQMKLEKKSDEIQKLINEGRKEHEQSDHVNSQVNIQKTEPERSADEIGLSDLEDEEDDRKARRKKMKEKRKK